MPDPFDSLLHEPPFVRTGPNTLSLHFTGGEMQSLMSVEQPNQLQVPYTRTMMGFLLLNPNPTHILMIGLGGGSMAKFCYQHLPTTRITVVEINPHVIALRRQFHIPDDDDRLKVVCADGADFVGAGNLAFDAILVDGYDLHGQAAPLCSRVFYQDCWRALVGGGVLVVNLDGDHPAHAAFAQRINAVCDFPAFYIGVEQRANRIVFAAKGVSLARQAMNLAASLGRRSWQAQAELTSEFNRILQTLDHSRGQVPARDALYVPINALAPESAQPPSS